jgi:hypothetical protein
MVDDHCHLNGLLRGNLCSGCNISEGVGRAELGQLYRGRFPAQILGYRKWYSGYGWPAGWWLDERQARRLTANPGWTIDVVHP